MGRYRRTAVLLRGGIICIAALAMCAPNATAAILSGSILPNGDMETEQLPSFPGFPDNWFASQTFDDGTGAFWETTFSVSPTHSLGLIDGGLAGPFAQTEWRSFALPIAAGTTSLHWQWDVLYDVTGGTTPEFTVNMRTGGVFIGSGNLVSATDHKLILTGSSNGQFVTMTADIPVEAGKESFDIIFLTEGSKDVLGSMFIDDVSVVPVVTLGDMDCDRDVDFDDIDAFVLGLTDPALYQAMFGVPSTLKGDIDMDRDQDFDDISGFVAILTAGGPQSIPEPSTLLLSVVGLTAYGLGWRRR